MKLILIFLLGVSLPIRAVTVGQWRGFQPEQVSGLKVYMRADSINVADGASVSTTTPSGGTFASFVQSGTLRPVFSKSADSGRPAIVFDGLTQHLTNGTHLGVFNSVSNGAMFVRFLQTTNSTTSSRGVFLVSYGTTVGSARASIFTPSTGNSLFVARRLDADSAATQIWVTNSAPVVAGVIINWGANIFGVWTNGGVVVTGHSISTAGATSATDSKLLGIGGGDTGPTFRGWVSKALIYQSVVSEQERNRIDVYLRANQ